MGIGDNGTGSSGSGGGGSGSVKNGGVWGGIIVEVYGSVVSVVAGVIVHIVLFLFLSSRFLFPLTYLRLERRQLQTHFSQKKKNLVVEGISNEPILYSYTINIYEIMVEA